MILRLFSIGTFGAQRDNNQNDFGESVNQRDAPSIVGAGRRISTLLQHWTQKRTCSWRISNS